MDLIAEWILKNPVGTLVLAVILAAHVGLVITAVRHHRRPSLDLLRRARLVAGLSVVLALLWGLLAQVVDWYIFMSPVCHVDALDWRAWQLHAYDEIIISPKLALLACIVPAIVWIGASIAEVRSRRG